MSIPWEYQEEVLRTLPGLSNVRVIRPGYAIAYDLVDPRELFPTLQTRRFENLFLAGQINGTTGYDEAAGQGIMAGINAALFAKGEELIVLRRDEAYIGVMIDDLINKGIEEPYRITPSHVEYRILLRQDNADIRLTPIGYKVGLVSYEKYKKVLEKKEKITQLMNILMNKKITPSSENLSLLSSIGEEPINTPYTLFDLMKRPSFGVEKLKKIFPEVNKFPDDVIFEVWVEARYSGYIKRQKKEIEELKRLERIKIPEDIDYNLVPNLSKQSVERLNYFKPKNMKEAKNITGVTPADLLNLLLYIERRKKPPKELE